MEHLDRYARQAVDMVTSGKAVRAFELEKEDPRLRDAYGRDSLGQKALLARRLVEAGVTFVLVSGAWGYFDHHGDNVRLEGDREGAQAAPAASRPGAGHPGQRPGTARAARRHARPDDGRVRPLARRSTGTPGATTGRTSCRWSWPAAGCGTARSSARTDRKGHAILDREGHPARPRRHRLRPPRNRRSTPTGSAPKADRLPSSPQAAGRSPNFSEPTQPCSTVHPPSATSSSRDSLMPTRLSFALLLMLVCVQGAWGGPPVGYQRDVQPILAEHCTVSRCG